MTIYSIFNTVTVHMSLKIRLKKCYDVKPFSDTLSFSMVARYFEIAVKYIVWWSNTKNVELLLRVATHKKLGCLILRLLYYLVGMGNFGLWKACITVIAYEQLWTSPRIYMDIYHDYCIIVTWILLVLLTCLCPWLSYLDCRLRLSETS